MKNAPSCKENVKKPMFNAKKSKRKRRKKKRSND
jgi:hypothetical protein